ncbi:MAG: class I SAM-dependent methyltransferase [Planctomycetota bacterium]|jgi:2-polyprenyl-3-methyl-5-hydroxy-6-metoxy-1,4-benzoquinol methylase
MSERTRTPATEPGSAFWNGYAADFDALYGTRHNLFNRVINSYLRASMRLRFEKTLAGCQPLEGRTALDIGCGPGHYVIALARGGAKRVTGLDFAKGMLEIARRHADGAGVADRCEFTLGDFMTYEAETPFDYVVLMGFLDYVPDARKAVERALSMTACKAFFSFPIAGGFLAWQRKLRYKRRCPLFLYDREDVESIFRNTTARDVAIEQIARDYFVTATMQ